MKIISVLYTNFQNDSRVQKMAASLKKHGHEIEIVAMFDGDVKEKEILEGIPVTRIRTRQKGKSKLSKTFRFLSFSFKAARKYRKADAWHCNDIEGFMVGMLAKTMRPKLQLVYDAHELESQRNNIKKWV
ncbi:MAG TPA: glycosyltransferase, partial [Flavobacteriales bacterium]|nr:glycosyltransferase [Flavobacteriales bacterium]